MTRMRELQIRYGRIQGYRNPRRGAWGFEIEGGQEALGYGVYTSARRSARKDIEKIRAAAERKGYSLKLTLDEGCGLGEDLKPIG